MAAAKVVFVGFSEAQRTLLFHNDGFAVLERTARVNGDNVHMTCHATPCGSEFDTVRAQGYSGCAAFVLLYDATSASSLAMVKHKWFPEIRRHAPAVPVILVGALVPPSTTTPTTTTPPPPTTTTTPPPTTPSSPSSTSTTTTTTTTTTTEHADTSYLLSAAAAFPTRAVLPFERAKVVAAEICAASFHYLDLTVPNTEVGEYGSHALFHKIASVIQKVNAIPEHARHLYISRFSGDLFSALLYGMCVDRA
jgi:hypothetical protein